MGFGVRRIWACLCFSYIGAFGAFRDGLEFGAFGIFEAGSIRGYLGLRGQIYLCFRRQGSRGLVASHKGGNRGISHRIRKKGSLG